ncbi:hypothetical protein RND71_032745 [Anisodus tanguticus]|uniref:Cytochrome P450 n=1 Tax=Anisodus tanguticus TaxID=243964 RepID=A0AAE1V0S4_9SOLA|nr:hypothetical protein RND71_032745 [Anisodus tanguticus]
MAEVEPGLKVYGSFFKSHILGCPTIVSMDPELNRYILVNEAKGLVPGYPQSMLDILGKCNIAAVNGSAHKYMRGALLSLISPTMIRDQLLPKIDEFMRSHLTNWDNKVIDIQEKTNKVGLRNNTLTKVPMAFLSSLKQIAGIESSSLAQEFMPEFFKLARKIIVSLLRTLIEERRASKQIQHDMLGYLMNEEASRYKLTDDEMIDLIITILYSGYETVSTTSMMAVKYLHDHPKVLEELRKEHMAIREKKKPEDPIDYNDYKAMRFTRADRNLENQNSFLIFGGGTRQCPGKELGVAEISTFLHYFVTKYR